MRQFECIADKKIYTESQLRQLFQFKIVHGYDKKFEEWIREEIQNGYLLISLLNNFIRVGIPEI